MKLISFNVNSINSYMKKNISDQWLKYNPDIISFQELKLTESIHENFPFKLDGYTPYWTVSKNKKGYSGTAILSKVEPINVHYGLLNNLYDDEGRAVTLEFDNFYIINLYVPNSGDGLKRLDYRMKFEQDLRSYLKNLMNNKPVIVNGDLNCAHEEIDLKNPATNHHSAGFTDEERAEFTKLLNIGLIDSFRELNPNGVKYSYWSYFFHARDTNAGWRLDYFLVDRRIFDKVNNSEILNEVYGSDHCPILLTIDL